ncbi:MAG: nucleoside hydrolase [Verrucomicrobiota bacterium]|jgi:inosine-uridine nucleoside N-ribohydrolase
MKTFSRLNRRNFLQKSGLLGAAIAVRPMGLPGWSAQSTADRKPTQPLPVILATDIGDDIDDTWALGLLLKCPELDLKLVVTEYGKAHYRARLLAKFLQATGHAGVPIAVGPDVEPRGEGGQAAWVKDYDLRSYPGKIHPEGVQALVETIMQSRKPVTLICIGPMPNVAAALAREPRIAKRARFVGMDGSVRLGYGGSKTISAEWNVKAAVKAAQQVLSAPWDITITPLDTCGLVTLEGQRYRRLLEAIDPVASTIIQNYRLWSRSNNSQGEAERRSSVLFDTVAVYLAFSQLLCKMERLGLRVSDEGYTLLDDHAKRMNVATEWKSLDGYRDFLVNRLVGP